MGYYVTGNGFIEYYESQEDELVSMLKNLNHEHHLKGGGRSPKTGDPYEDSWFAWMPAKYHEDENLRTVASILELLGFEVDTERDAGSVKHWLKYDNKTGAEQLFMEQLGRAGVDMNIVWDGEEGEQWEVMACAGDVRIREAQLHWSEWREYDERTSIQNFNMIVESLRKAFVNE